MATPSTRTPPKPELQKVTDVPQRFSGAAAANDAPATQVAEKPPLKPTPPSQPVAHADPHPVANRPDKAPSANPRAAQAPRFTAEALHDAAEVRVTGGRAAANAGTHAAPDAKAITDQTPSASRAVAPATTDIAEAERLKAQRLNSSASVRVTGAPAAANEAVYGTKKVVVEEALEAGGKQLLKKAAGPVVGAAFAAPDIIDGIKEGGRKGEEKAVRGTLKAVVSGVLGTFGALLGSAVGPVGTVGGAVAGGALGDKLVDSMGPSEGLTDRSGKKIATENNYGINRQRAGTQYDRLVAEARARDEAAKAAAAAAVAVPAAAAAAAAVAAPAPARAVKKSELPDAAAPAPAQAAAPREPAAKPPRAARHAEHKAHDAPNAIAKQLMADIQSHIANPSGNTEADKEAIARKTKLAQNPNVTVDDIRKAYGLGDRSLHMARVAATDAMPLPTPGSDTPGTPTKTK